MYTKSANNKTYIIIGPSASGKTNLGIEIAKKLGKDIISADSRQIYKKLDYSTGKISNNDSSELYQTEQNKWTINEVNYWGYDVVTPNIKEADFNFSKFVEELFAKNKHFVKNPPIIVGGTGFYISQLIDRNFITEVEPDYDLRETLSELDTRQLQQVLRTSLGKPLTLNNSEMNNRQRLIRRIEIAQSKKIGNKENNKNNEIGEIYKKATFVGIDTIEYKSKIRKWINKNFENIRQEVIWLNNNYPNSHLLKGFIFYEMTEFINGNIEKKEAKKLITTKYLQYIKRQRTYFKKHFKKTKWFSTAEEAFKYITSK